MVRVFCRALGLVAAIVAVALRCPGLVWRLPWPVHHTICALTGYRLVQVPGQPPTWTHWPLDADDK